MCSSSFRRLSLRDPNSTTFSFPPLNTWAEQHLTAVLTAQSQPNFTTAFNDCFAKNVSVTFNGVKITHDGYEQQLLGDVSPESLAVVDILSIVQAAEFGQGASEVRLPAS